MSDRPTPETDAAMSVGLENADRECVPADFSRRLEQERDEAREAAAKWEAIALREASINGSKFLSMQHGEELNPRFEINPETSKWYRVNS